MKRTLGCLSVLLFLGLFLACSRTSKESSASQPNSGMTAGMSAGMTAAQPSTSQAIPAQAPEKPAAAADHAGVFINGRELSSDQVMALTATYHYAPIPGHFWYDTLSGAWGVEGREALGFLLPGYDFGPLAANSSRGNTGVFINGRELNMVEAASLQRTFGAVYQGHWWLDGRTGNYGVEGNPMPVGNIMAALRAQNSGRNGDNFWSSATARGNSSGGCTYVNVGGTTATSGCD